MLFRKLMEKIIRHEDLTEQECGEALEAIFTGETDPATVAGFLAALAVKGESASELTGAARVLRRNMQRIQTPASLTVDTCGTGGDGADTFNISTTAAFVVAGCGAVVAKHGNRSVSSQCGSADVLETLGVRLDIPAEAVEEALFEIHIGFLFAPNFHAAVRHAGPARKALGIRTLFNAIGPMANPAAASCQVIGVFKPELTESMGQALLDLGTRKAFVVHGHDGLDEISVCAPTRVTEAADGRLKTYDLYPEIYFGEPADPEDLKGGDATNNAAITRAVLSGEKGAKRNIVLINSAAALVACDKAKDIKDGIKLAGEAIDSGAALAKLEALIQFTQEAAGGR
ncbi:anthranilate phosphoribosyltransferase [Desulfobotulus sp. H1]|uniref:Anthranilate phosphoribosyltransferase n=1 Tax=Desulfobotulus pelophilus TaxID=2823377 RepID=A0ABT3N9J3_9BACT|nr:anthranilate phosphoribosyltransferase [Desulfobotulus pelophilus]MCW7754130.1 anthranilate phosphoribosyltransferase [Desulfobotulus pelophilus]